MSRAPAFMSLHFPVQLQSDQLPHAPDTVPSHGAPAHWGVTPKPFLLCAALVSYIVEAMRKEIDVDGFGDIFVKSLHSYTDRSTWVGKQGKPLPSLCHGFSVNGVKSLCVDIIDV